MTASGNRSQVRRRVAAAFLVAIACAGAVAGLFLYFVGDAHGQRIDQSALTGARIGRARILDSALEVLGLVSIVAIAAGTLAVLVVALLRRRVDLVVGAVVVVLGSNVTTQVVKHHLLVRPNLGVDISLSNSLPSGHTTVAASLAAAAVLVFPGAMRAVAAAVGAGATTVIGVSTLAAGWHRPSDVVAALLVVAGWTCFVAALLAVVASRRPRVGGQRRERPGVATGIAMTGIGVVALVPAAAAMWRLSSLPDLAESRRDLFVAYAGGAIGIFAVSALGFGVILWVCAGLARDETRKGTASDAVDGHGSVVLRDGAGDDSGVARDASSVGRDWSAVARSRRAFASGA